MRILFLLLVVCSTISPSYSMLKSKTKGDIFAAISKRNGSLQALLGNEDELEKQNNRGETPLLYALKEYLVQVRSLGTVSEDKAATWEKDLQACYVQVQMLLRAGASVAVQDQAGLTPVWYAIMCYRSLPDVENEDARTKKQLFDLIITLREKSSEQEVLNKEGMSLLHYTVLHGVHDIAGQLLQHGAKCDIVCNGSTPFEVLLQQCLGAVKQVFTSEKDYQKGLYAKFEHCYAMIPVFLMYDIKLDDHKDKHGRTALFHVVMAYILLPEADSEYKIKVKSCLYNLMKDFIRMGSSVDVRDESNNTLLLLALQKRAIEVAVLLRGTEQNPPENTSIHAVCENDMTPLDYVVNTGDIDLISLMTLKMSYDDYRVKHDKPKNGVSHLAKRIGRRGSLRIPRRKLSGLLGEKNGQGSEDKAPKKGSKKKGSHLDRVRKKRSQSMSNITLRSKPPRDSDESEAEDSSVLERLREKLTVRKLSRRSRKSVIPDDSETDDEAVEDSFQESADGPTGHEGNDHSLEQSAKDEIEESWQEIFSSLGGSEIEDSKRVGEGAVGGDSSHESVENHAVRIFQAIDEADVETLCMLVTDEAALSIEHESCLSVLLYAVNHILSEISFQDVEKRLEVVASLCCIAMIDLSDQEEESSTSNEKAAVLECALIKEAWDRVSQAKYQEEKLYICSHECYGRLRDILKPYIDGE